MTYVDANAAKQRPIMIHRAIFGSMERFFGILVENYAGAFPLWLAPVQARLLPVNDAVVPYVQEVRQLAQVLQHPGMCISCSGCELSMCAAVTWLAPSPLQPFVCDFCLNPVTAVLCTASHPVLTYH
jgi:threonyl-tRNA synthetase